MTVIKYLIPTQGMMGLRSEMFSATRGTAIGDSMFDSYREKIVGDILSQDKGSLLAFEDDVVASFGCEGAQDQEELFVESGIDVYKNILPVVPTRR